MSMFKFAGTGVYVHKRSNPLSTAATKSRLNLVQTFNLAVNLNNGFAVLNLAQLGESNRFRKRPIRRRIKRVSTSMARLSTVRLLAPYNCSRCRTKSFV